jgi:hypothetical protein
MLMDPSNAGELEVNKQYQEAIKIVINLVTASLVLPVVFLKNIVGTQFNKIGSLSSWAYASWGCLGLSLLACVAFYWCSTKYTKALYKLDKDNEKQVELWRDRSARFATVTAFIGLILLLFFLWKATEAQEASSTSAHPTVQSLPN